MARRRSLLQRVPLAPVFAAMFGAAAAILVAATPTWLFEANVVALGLDTIVDVARPPLGVKARVLASVLALLTVGGLVWAATALVLRLARADTTRATDDEDALDLATYAAPLEDVAPRRRPIFADRELGARFMSDAALATATPVAEPDESGETDAAPIETLPESADPQLAVPLAVEEFDLPEMPEQPLRLSGESEIEALIRRLEAGLAKRGDSPPTTPGAPAATRAKPSDWLVRAEGPGDEDGFDDGATRALATLRRMAQ